MKDMDTVFLKLKVEKGRLRYCGIDVSTPTLPIKTIRNATKQETKTILDALYAGFIENVNQSKGTRLNLSMRIGERLNAKKKSNS